jgi:predicted alpha/beta-fold hydrolase
MLINQPQTRQPCPWPDRHELLELPPSKNATLQNNREITTMAIAPAPVTDELIEMRGLRFHYRDWRPKRAGAPTLVLLHGFTGHARSWDAFADAMTDRYRVLALDQRGHGETAWAPPDR